MKFTILLPFIMAITFSQYAIANECTSEEDQRNYVTNFMSTFSKYVDNVKNTEKNIRNQLSQKANNYAKSGLITQEQARNLFINTLKDPIFTEFEKEKGIIHSEFMVQVALFEVEKSKNSKDACFTAKKAISLFEKIHQVNLKQYKVLDEKLELKKTT